MTTAKTAAATPASTESYAAGYAALAAIAERLRTASGAATIDSLVADAQEAQRLYERLKARLDTIRRELDAGAGSSEVGGAA